MKPLSDLFLLLIVVLENAEQNCRHVLSFCHPSSMQCSPSFPPFCPSLLLLAPVSIEPSPSSLTLGLLKAVAPLVVGQLAVLEGVAGVEERLHAQLVLVQVDGAQLRLVQQEVKVDVQLVEHPAQ